jgi:predicted metalloprotease with PDZ domain
VGLLNCTGLILLQIGDLRPCREIEFQNINPADGKAIHTMRKEMNTKPVIKDPRYVTPKKLSRAMAGVLAIAAVLVASSGEPRAASQSDKFRIDYIVRIASLDQHLFHVIADVKNIDQPTLELSLPTWTPGWYTVENYAKNFVRFRVADAKGDMLPHTMTKKQTWRIETRGLDRIEVEFDYYANILSLNQAKIASDFAFFTGTELFLMAQDHRNNPSSVRLEIPKGWKVASALQTTSDPMVFTAPDYDTLVDSPTEMGNFDLTSFQVEGRPHYLVVTPVGSLSKENAERFCGMLTGIAHADSRMFGGLPYAKYTYFYFFARAESNASGALEHLSSHVLFAPPGGYATPERLANTAAHEYFHLWNVKRIRPIEMWPYEYSREDETPLLWVSEGFTNYYGNLAQYRAGLIDQAKFLSTVADAIGGVENNDAREYISPSEASVSTWLGYDTPVEFGISYYTQGQNLAALLDLSIRHDTGAAHGLDDVMVSLFHDFYQQGKGFSTEDMIGVINKLTGRDYHDFYRKYVDGVQVPPYDEVLGYAGYRVEKSLASGPRMGGRATARRAAEIKAEGKQPASYSLIEDPHPSPDQLRVRSAWLRIDK